MRSARYYELVEQYRKVHKAGFYGNAGANKAQHILPLVDFPVRSILDYGCGRCDLIYELAKELKAQETYKFDPAVEEYHKPPGWYSASLLICTDVLEHVPEEDVRSVLDEMSNLSDNCFFAISTRPAGKTLPNGENAHTTVRPKDWWLFTIQRVFNDARVVHEAPGEGIHIVTWKERR